jgi:predicted RNA-binding Zn-ribbon protein involved in translation (DUF1610 family)
MEWSCSKLTFLTNSNSDIKFAMMNTDGSLKFVCPVCGAKPQERCKMNSGMPRLESHRERRDVSKDKAATMISK